MYGWHQIHRMVPYSLNKWGNNCSRTETATFTNVHTLKMTIIFNLFFFLCIFTALAGGNNARLGLYHAWGKCQPGCVKSWVLCYFSSRLWISPTKKNKNKNNSKKKTTMEAVSTIMRTYFHSSDQLKSTVLNSRSESSAIQSITLCFVISLK